MTDLERISHYRRRLVLFNPVGLLMLVAAIFLRARFFPDMSGPAVLLFLLIPGVFISIGIATSVQLIMLQHRLKNCGDELAISNRNSAVRWAFVATLVGLLPLMVLAMLFDRSAMLTLLGVETLMLGSLAISWLVIEYRQGRDVSTHE